VRVASKDISMADKLVASWAGAKVGLWDVAKVAATVVPRVASTVGPLAFAMAVSTVDPLDVMLAA